MVIPVRQIMNQLKVSFMDPEHGWITVSIVSTQGEVSIDAATHVESFQELITALIGLTDQRAKYTILWLEEPQETKWRFIREHNLVTFTCYRSHEDPAVLALEGTYNEICLPFWRAMRELTGRYTREELDNRIQEEFPYAELERLTRLIENTKRMS